MKLCKKCNNEYKDDYSYCPKCGKPYDDSKKQVKNPSSNDIGDIAFKVWNIILYIFGSFMILGSIFNITESPLFSIFGTLFGLSLFQVFYKIIENKFNIDPKYLKIARVVLPIVLFIICCIFAPPENNSNNKKPKKSNDYIENPEIKQDTPPVEDNSDNDSSKSTTPSKTDYMDSLRKCSVMEAADIYTTGVGQKSDNVFNDGRKTCEKLYKQLGEDEFTKTVEEDWKNRQNEQIDGKPLSHYLEVLGW